MLLHHIFSKCESNIIESYIIVTILVFNFIYLQPVSIGVAHISFLSYDCHSCESNNHKLFDPFVLSNIFDKVECNVLCGSIIFFSVGSG